MSLSREDNDEIILPLKKCKQTHETKDVILTLNQVNRQVISEKNELKSTFFLRRTNTENAIAVHGDKDILFQNVSYQMLTHLTPIQPSSKLSCRGSNRETIIIDFESNNLNQYFSEYLKIYYETVNGESPTQPLDEEPIEIVLLDPCHLEVLKDLLKFIKKKFKSTNEEQIATLVNDRYEKQKDLYNVKIALLEWFWDSGIGFCRHQALATAYLLVKLIEYHAEKYGKSFEDTENKVFRFRTQLQVLDNIDKKISHAMVVYHAADGHYYLLDSTRKKGLVIDLSDLTSDDREILKESYFPFDSDLLIKQIVEAYSIPTKTPFNSFTLSK